MTIHLSIPLFLPLAAGLAGLFAPRAARWLVLAASLGVLGYAIAIALDFEQGGGLQYVTQETWISELGVHYALGIEGLNLPLVALTALLWPFALLLAFGRRWEREHHFYFHMALAETAVLGAFLAQDLALFVVFFDAMLVPFYFLVGIWGHGERVRATTKLVIYTLVGSLLMLAGAIALGVLATPEGGEISYLLADLEQRVPGEGTQHWIFALFAIAFLVKAPVFPVHGWMPDAYRATPLPVLMVFSGVLSKVGVYGFLQVALPAMPDAASHYRDVILVIAVFSILYGSVLAFSQDEARLVVGYSSIAQLGFILLGIFSLDAKGAQGALMQMVNHGLVAAALFAIVAALALRAGGSERLSEMGGIALRAPVLAALFLIVALATLAMPGSPNFVGEILILFGAFEDRLVFGVVASAGVALAAVYMIRMLQRAMHNRAGERVSSRDLRPLELAVVAPLAAAIVLLGVYPQPLLDHSEEATVRHIVGARAVAAGVDVDATDDGGAPGTPADDAPPVEEAVPGSPPDAHSPEEADPEELEP